MTKRFGTVAMGAALLVALLSNTAQAEPLSSRPHGNVMGDGLNLSVETPGPQHAVLCGDYDESLFGIDVSYYQGTIDWNAVAADGVRYAIVRVSHSLEFFDPEFQNNLDGSRAAGIHTGVYQYFEPDEDPVAQADLLLDNMGPLLPGDLPPVIDVESTAGQSPAAITAAVQAWVDRVESELGVKPIIYTNGYFWQDNVGSAAFSDYPLWVPHYTNNCPNVPNQWSDWLIHQYSDSGSVAGIGGNVDVNHFDGTEADLMALGGASECGDGVCSGGENAASCAEDCEPCGTIAADGGQIENDTDCYQLHGNPDYWREEATGEGGSLVWTNATNNATPSNYAVWELYFDETGTYEVEVSIDPTFAQTQQAAYQVAHADGETEVVIDQSGSDGWTSLGEFGFAEATDHSIVLGDNTGENGDLDIAIVFDAIRFTRTDPPDGQDPTDSDSGDDSDSGGDSASASGGDSESDGVTDGSSDSAGDGETDDVGGTDGDDPDDDDGNGDTDGGPASAGPNYLPGSGEVGGDGCGCSAAPSRFDWAGLLLLLGLGFRRRRR